MRCNGVELFVKTAGERGNPALLLLHGNGEDHTIFDAALNTLAGRYFVIAPDSRGHGASQPVARYDYGEMARDMAALLDGMNVRDVCVFGFSDGGITALLMAIFYPQRLARVIAAGANTHPLGVKTGCFIGVLRDWIRTREGRSELMLTQPHITRAQLRRIRLPVCILAGENDVIRPAHTRALAKSIPGARLRVVPGADHGSYIVGSDRFIEEARL